MKETVELTPAERFRITMELFETGINIMRQTLERDYPDATEREIDDRLKAWLQHRPGAEYGDCPGRRLDWPLEPR